MKKKYTDPLMFSTVMLAGINMARISPGGSGSPDDDWDTNETGDGGNSSNTQPDILLMPAENPDSVSEPEADPVEIVEPDIVPEVPTVLEGLTGDDTSTAVAPGTGE